MVKILLAASLSLASMSWPSPWIQQFPKSTGQQLHSVFFVDSNFGWAVGIHGTLLHSENGGADWVAQTLGTSENLAEIQFVDRNRGWAIGDGGIIAHTEDGGANWRLQPSGTNRALFTLKFFGPDTGWVTGDGGTVLRTVNGGGRWTPMLNTAQYRNADCRYSSFIDGSTGWVNTSWNLLHTGDGGKTWTEIADPKWTAAIQFLDRQNGWSYDLNSINRTQDGGLTWTEALWAQGVRAAFHFFTPDSGWVRLMTGSVLRTADGGKTWVKGPEIESASESVFFLDENRGWVIGPYNKFIVRTVDGGKTWSKIDTSQAFRFLLSVAAVDSLTAWTVGDSGWMAHTSDGGATWLPQASGTASRLNCVRFLDARAGWIVGDKGIILHTSDGGNVWRPQTSGTATRLRTLFIATADTGWAGETPAYCSAPTTEEPIGIGCPIRYREPMWTQSGSGMAKGAGSSPEAGCTARRMAAQLGLSRSSAMKPIRSSLFLREKCTFPFPIRAGRWGRGCGKRWTAGIPGSTPAIPPSLLMI